MIDDWNAAIANSGLSGLPTFDVLTSPGIEDVVVGGATSGSVWCGAADDIAMVITLYSGVGCSGNTGGLGEVLTHELSHIYGWTGTHVHKPDGSTGKSDHCATVLPEGGSINTNVCAHMLEGAAAAYGFRSYDPDNFWNHEFVTGVWFNAIDTIRVGNTYQIQEARWVLDRGGMLAEPVAWSGSPGSVVTVLNGLVTGVSAGSGSIKAFPVQSSGYLFSRRSELGSPWPITVLPQLPALLSVQDITINTSLPITDPGTFTWTAVMPAGDVTGITYRWVIEYSHGSPVDTVFHPERAPNDTIPPFGSPPFAGNTWQGVALAGSYNIRVKVWPARDTTVGSPQVRDFPVCTDSIPYLRMEESPPGTDAVEGC